MKKIYLDESGNTGADLLDSKQPTFVLSSNDYSDEEASELIQCVKSDQGGEIKFSRLKKSGRGRRRLLEFIEQELINKDRVKTTVFHKKYMTLTKVVDILIENVAHATGMDIYENGLNIAMSNMHYHCMPTFCGEERFEIFLNSFVKMVREQTEESINEFYDSAENIQKNSIEKKYLLSLSPILISRDIIGDILKDNDYLSLDPAVPSLFNHCTSWGDRFSEEFVIIHDSSKPIRAQLDVFNAFMDKRVPYQEIGYDRRKFIFPLRSTDISFGDSENHHQIQISDLVASATAYVSNSIATDKHDDLSKSLRDRGIEELMINVIWPAPDVTPESLGTMASGGVNAVNHITSHIGR